VWNSKVPMRWRPSTFDIRTGEFRNLVRRSREVVLLAALTGAVTGLFVRFFEYVVIEVIYERISHGPLWLGAVAPGVGLVLSAIVLRRSATGHRRRRRTSTCGRSTIPSIRCGPEPSSVGWRQR
jgi:chloride channel protein, CIC family